MQMEDMHLSSPSTSEFARSPPGSYLGIRSPKVVRKSIVAMDLQGPASILHQLLHSGDYSDLTLTCQGEVFKLHKAVVCPQSPVIATAVRGNFKVRVRLQHHPRT